MKNQPRTDNLAQINKVFFFFFHEYLVCFSNIEEQVSTKKKKKEEDKQVWGVFLSLISWLTFTRKMVKNQTYWKNCY